MEQGTVARWLKAVGDAVAVGEVIAEIETDKATMELEAEQAGTIGRILAADGATVAVGAPIGVLLGAGEQQADLGSDWSGGGEEASAAAAGPALVATSPVGEAPPAPAAAVPAPTAVGAARRRTPSSPLARRLARERGLEIEGLNGSGPQGRVVRIDVETAAAAQPEPPPVAAAAAPAQAPRPAKQPFVEIPLTSMRKVIARRLAESKATVPHFYLEVDCEIDALLELRERLNAEANGQYRLSVNDFVIKAAALAMRQVPEANTAWADDAILQFEDVDISVAVATDGGLLTPIVRQADTASLSGISARVKTLAERARAGQLQPAEYKGGSFTISNLGMFGVRAFAAIINPPQSCILAVGAAESRPVVKGGVCVAATVMSCTLSVDHRAVDGAVGARFLSAFKALIEQPLRVLL